MKYPIQTVKPPEPPSRNVGRRPKYPFAELKAGKCFFVPLSDFDQPVNAAVNLRAAAGAWKRRTGSKLNLRVAATKDPNGVPSVGVWAYEPVTGDASA